MAINLFSSSLAFWPKTVTSFKLEDWLPPIFYFEYAFLTIKPQQRGENQWVPSHTENALALTLALALRLKKSLFFFHGEKEGNNKYVVRAGRVQTYRVKGLETMQGVYMIAAMDP